MDDVKDKRIGSDFAAARIATMTGSTSEFFIQKEYPQAPLFLFDDINDAFLALQTGKADYQPADVPSVKQGNPLRVGIAANREPMCFILNGKIAGLGAYSSEMFRTSIQSVDKGQTEAGTALGFTKIQTFIHVVFPQALKNVIPVYKGEVISLLKNTSIVGYIAVVDLTKAFDLIRSRTFDAFFPLIVVAVIYFLLAWLLGTALDKLNFNTSVMK